MRCGKKGYNSAKSARRAHSKASFRLSTYWCDRCGKYHVTNRQKYRDSRRKEVRA